MSRYNDIRSLADVKSLAVSLCSFVCGLQIHCETVRFYPCCEMNGVTAVIDHYNTVLTSSIVGRLTDWNMACV